MRCSVTSRVGFSAYITMLSSCHGCSARSPPPLAWDGPSHLGWGRWLMHGQLGPVVCLLHCLPCSSCVGCPSTAGCALDPMSSQYLTRVWAHALLCAHHVHAACIILKPSLVLQARQFWVTSEYGRGVGPIHSYTRGLGRFIPTGWPRLAGCAAGPTGAGGTGGRGTCMGW